MKKGVLMAKKIFLGNLGIKLRHVAKDGVCSYLLPVPKVYVDNGQLSLKKKYRVEVTEVLAE